MIESSTIMADADFDVEALRHPHESMPEWKIRRAFLATHSDKFDLDRLLCLASCYINVECYGCQYPEGVMFQLKELMEELGDEHHEHRAQVEQRNQVKFVKASEGTKAAGPSSAKKKGMTFVKATEDYQSTDIRPKQQTVLSPPVATKKLGGCEKVGRRNIEASNASHDSFGLENTDYSKQENKFYIMAEILGTGDEGQNVINFVYAAANKAKVNIQCSIELRQQGFECQVQLDFVHAASAFATSKKTAKLEAFLKCKALLLMPCLHLHKVSVDKFELQGSTMQSKPKPSMYPPAQQARGNNRRPISHAGAPQQMRKRGAFIDMSQFLVIKREYLRGQNVLNQLNETVAFNKMTVDYDFREQGLTTLCQVMLEGSMFLAEGSAETKQDAKEMACARAIEDLQKKQWTLIVKGNVDSSEENISRDEVFGNMEMMAQSIPSSNIGNKLLQKMGWSGGGVGADGNKGIAEPVSVASVVNRQGLGLQAEQGIPKNFLPRIRDVIQKYASSYDEGDLAFSPDFSKEERALIHKESLKLGLKSHSHGSGSDRHLVLSRKRNKVQLFYYIMNQGGETSKYKLLPPGTSQTSSC